MKYKLHFKNPLVFGNGSLDLFPIQSYFPTRKVKSESESCLVMSDSVTSWTIQSMEFSRPEYWSGQLSLLQGIFPTQGSNPGSQHCRQILSQLNHKGSPRILEWVAFSSPGDLPNPGIEPRSPTLQVDSLPAEPPGKPIQATQVIFFLHLFHSVQRNSHTFHKTSEVFAVTIDGKSPPHGVPALCLLRRLWWRPRVPKCHPQCSLAQHLCQF